MKRLRIIADGGCARWIRSGKQRAALLELALKKAPDSDFSLIRIDLQKFGQGSTSQVLMHIRYGFPSRNTSRFYSHILSRETHVLQVYYFADAGRINDQIKQGIALSKLLTLALDEEAEDSSYE